MIFLAPSQSIMEYSNREKNTRMTQANNHISKAVTEFDTGILELKKSFNFIYVGVNLILSAQNTIHAYWHF